MPAQRDDLQTYLDDAVVRHGFPGAAAGVLVEGEVVTAASGVTSIEHPLPVDSHTLFQAGSVTKTFTSAAVMVLVDEGKVSLDDPVAKHLPGLGTLTSLDTDAITIEHLLSHQAGFDGDHHWCHGADSLAAIADARRLFEPGTGFSYNNAAFSIAGAVIEKISGQTYTSFVRERFLDPLGMDRACFSADEAITHRVAAPHLILGETKLVLRNVGWQPGWELSRLDVPAGGLIASVEDLLKWCRFQMTGETPDGKRLIERDSLDRLQAAVVGAEATFDVALDWFVRTASGVKTIEHPGETVGYSTTLVVAPDRGVGVVVLTNAVGGFRLNGEVRRWALKHFADIEESKPEPRGSVDIEPFLGRFLHPFNILVVTPGEDDASIVISGEKRDDTAWPPFAVHQPTKFRFFAPDHAVNDLGSVVRFGSSDGGRPDWTLFEFRRCPRID